MKRKVFGVIYDIIDGTNDFEYIGQTTRTVEERFKEHARNKKYLIGKAIHKYDKKKFCYGVIKSCFSKEELAKWEKYFIAALKSKSPFSYNCTDDGDGIIGCTDETRASRSAKLKGVPKSSEHCAAIAAGHKGKFVGEKNHRFGKHHTKTTSYTILVKQRGDSPFKNLLNEIDTFELTYAVLAKLMGLVSSSSISDKMHGRKNFTAHDKVKLEEIFGKPAEYLLLQHEIAAEIKQAKPKYSPFKNLLSELDAKFLSYSALAKCLGSS